MTFVDHDHVEIISRIVLGEEGEFFFFKLVDSEALIGRDVNAGVLRRVAAFRVAANHRGLAAEEVGERGGRLRTQFVAIANEERATGHAGIEQTAQEVGAMKVLPAPVASVSSARFSPLATFSKTARIAAS